MPTQLKQIRQKLEQLPHQNYWNISPQVGEYLRNLVIKLNVKRLLEIGTSNGYSATWFAEGLQATGGKMWTVESHAERYAEATANIAAAGLSNIVTQIKGHAPEILVEYPEIAQIDFAFFDATKGEYSQYLQAVLPLFSPKGIIFADNVKSHWDSLSDFVDATQQLKGYTPKLNLELGTGLLTLIPTQQLSNIDA